MDRGWLSPSAKLATVRPFAATGFAPAAVARFVELLGQKVRPGGLVAIETPNPECLAIFATHFYIDPTHTRPVPAVLLHYYLEEAGFGTIETEYINHPSKEVPSQLRIRRGVANTIPFEEILSVPGSGFAFCAEAFAKVVAARDTAAIERAAAASLDIATTLEAIAQSARSGRPMEVAAA